MIATANNTLSNLFVSAQTPRFAVEHFLRKLNCNVPNSQGHHSESTCLSVLMESDHHLEQAHEKLRHIPMNRGDQRQECFGTSVQEMHLKHALYTNLRPLYAQNGSNPYLL